MLWETSHSKIKKFYMLAYPFCSLSGEASEMADLQSFNLENTKERARLKALAAGLKEGDFTRRLPNGWTVGATLAHLAFWDLRQVNLLKRWLEKDAQPASIDPDAINGPLAVLSEKIPAPAVVQLVTDAAEQADGAVEKLTPSQAETILKIGSERFLRRALHRREHLDKIEKTLHG
jgi:hypothetical protein